MTSHLIPPLDILKVKLFSVHNFFVHMEKLYFTFTKVKNKNISKKFNKMSSIVLGCSIAFSGGKKIKQQANLELSLFY